MVLDGKTLIYAAVGDSCGLLAVPASAGGAPRLVEELVAEHLPTRVSEYAARLRHHPEMRVVYSSQDMFEGDEHLLHVFCKGGDGQWTLDQESIRRAEEVGRGVKSPRGDRHAVLLTPLDGVYSGMMLTVTRSLGDFYHQRFGVTWRPEVVVRPLAEALGGAESAVLCVATDGVWDLWSFEEAMGELCTALALGDGAAREEQVRRFFEESRAKGEKAFGDRADNLTGVVALLSRP